MKRRSALPIAPSSLRWRRKLVPAILRRHRAADGEARWLRIDPWQQRGPAVWAGHPVRLRGQLVEVYRDRALALPPLNTTLAQRMMEQTRIFTALKGVRGRKPVNMAALEQLLVRFSQLVLEQPWIAEIDINPLLASPERILALDARIVLHGPTVTSTSCPSPPSVPIPYSMSRPGP